MQSNDLEELLSLEIIRLSNAREILCPIPHDISLVMQAGRAFGSSKAGGQSIGNDTLSRDLEEFCEEDQQHYYLFAYSAYLESARLRSTTYLPDAFLLSAIRTLSEDLTHKRGLGYTTPTFQNLTRLNREAWLRGII